MDCAVRPYHGFFWVYTSKRIDAETKVKMGLIRSAHYEMFAARVPPTHQGQGTFGLRLCETGLERFEQIERSDMVRPCALK